MTLLEVAKTVFVAHQPIMNVCGRVEAYELLFRDGPTASATIADDFVCTATVVERTLTPEIEWFLRFVDTVKIDWPLVVAEDLASLVSFFRRAGKRVLVEKIEHPCDRALATGLGCDYLQEYYFAGPQVLSGRSAIPSLATMMHIIALLDGERPNGELAHAVEENAATGGATTGAR